MQNDGIIAGKVVWLRFLVLVRTALFWVRAGVPGRANAIADRDIRQGGHEIRDPTGTPTPSDDRFCRDIDVDPYPNWKIVYIILTQTGPNKRTAD
jgi:hypothetical protein